MKIMQYAIHRMSQDDFLYYNSYLSEGLFEVVQHQFKPWKLASIPDFSIYYNHSDVNIFNQVDIELPNGVATQSIKYNAGFVVQAGGKVAVYVEMFYGSAKIVHPFIFAPVVGPEVSTPMSKVVYFQVHGEFDHPDQNSFTSIFNLGRYHVGVWFDDTAGIEKWKLSIVDFDPDEEIAYDFVNQGYPSFAGYGTEDVGQAVQVAVNAATEASAAAESASESAETIDKKIDMLNKQYISR
jgi:hypothetical protein